MDDLYSIFCEDCQTELEVDEDYYLEIAGQAVECPNCEGTIEVPAISSSENAEASQESCVNCDQPLQPGAIVCIECGTRQDTGKSVNTKPEVVLSSLGVRKPKASAQPPKKSPLPLMLGGGLAVIGIGIGIFLLMRPGSSSPQHPSTTTAAGTPDQAKQNQQRRDIAKLSAWISRPQNYVPSKPAPSPWAIPTGYKVKDTWVTPDNKHLFYTCVAKGNLTRLYCDGVQVEVEGSTDSAWITMSPDCRHIAYMTMPEDGSRLFIDDSDQQIPVKAWQGRFSPDSKQFAASLIYKKSIGEHALILNGALIDHPKRIDTYDWLGENNLFVAGDFNAALIRKFVPLYIGGTWHEKARFHGNKKVLEIHTPTTQKYRLIINGAKGSEHEEIGEGRFLKRSETYIYEIKKSGKRQLIMGEIISPLYDETPLTDLVGSTPDITASENGKYFAYIGVRDSKSYLVLNDMEFPIADGYEPFGLKPAISPDGTLVGTLLKSSEHGAPLIATAVQVNETLNEPERKRALSDLSILQDNRTVYRVVVKGQQHTRRWALNVGGKEVGESPAATQLPNGSYAYFVLGLNNKHSILMSNSRIPVTHNLASCHVRALIPNQNGTHFVYSAYHTLQKKSFFRAIKGDFRMLHGSNRPEVITSNNGRRVIIKPGDGKYYCEGLTSYDDHKMSNAQPAKNLPPTFSDDSEWLHFGVSHNGRLVSWMNDKWSEPYDTSIAPPVFTKSGIVHYVIRDGAIQRLASQ